MGVGWAAVLAAVLLSYGVGLGRILVCDLVRVRQLSEALRTHLPGVVARGCAGAEKVSLSGLRVWRRQERRTRQTWQEFCAGESQRCEPTRGIVWYCFELGLPGVTAELAPGAKLSWCELI